MVPRMRALVVTVLLAAACNTSPEELGRERGAVETMVAWPCKDGRALGAVVGGDLKTDWTAKRNPDGSYRVVFHGAPAATWDVREQGHTATPVDDGARAAWVRCQR